MIAPYGLDHLLLCGWIHHTAFSHLGASALEGFTAFNSNFSKVCSRDGFQMAAA
jgi:hypothetical protein